MHPDWAAPTKIHLNPLLNQSFSISLRCHDFELMKKKNHTKGLHLSCDLIIVIDFSVKFRLHHVAFRLRNAS